MALTKARLLKHDFPVHGSRILFFAMHRVSIPKPQNSEAAGTAIAYVSVCSLHLLRAARLAARTSQLGASPSTLTTATSARRIGQRVLAHRPSVAASRIFFACWKMTPQVGSFPAWRSGSACEGSPWEVGTRKNVAVQRAPRCLLERPCASQGGGSMLLRREGGFLRRGGGFLRRRGGS